ncbi:aromatic prenyltransferase [Achaetomium macrosporum]|uniref:Aromatic prenyltransferase n=1 Tax=Achaetomium macrosporum TaxID=79813 RepID=A0AAN7C2N1_9PEZI|nr:aromatic prenyltransferase [Achaetomium macrosporum]
MVHQNGTSKVKPSDGESASAWKALSQYLPARNADYDFWWQFTGGHLATILEEADYPMHKQYEALLFHYHWAVPYMGPAPRADGKALRWKSLVQPDGTPIEYSWKWPIKPNDRPEVRYDFEPIGEFAGVGEVDPLNQLATREMLGRLAAVMPSVDNTWFHHLLSTLYEHDYSKLAAEAKAVAPVSTTVLVAAEFYAKGVVFKTYCQPRLLGHPGVTPIPLYEEAIRQMEPNSPAREAVHDFLATSPEGQLMSPFSVGIDNVAPEKSRLKWYFNSPHTSFASVRHIMTLNGRITSPHLAKQLADLSELIKTVLGLPPDFPDDAHAAVELGAESPYSFPTPAAPHPDESTGTDAVTPSPVLPGYVYYFDVAPGQALPGVKFSIPLRNYARDDLSIAQAFTAFMDARGRGAYSARYMALLERLAAEEGARLADKRGLQAFISVLFRSDGELDITTYFAAQAFKPWPAPRRSTLRRGEGY